MRRSWIRVSLTAAVLTAALTVSAAAASFGTGVVDAGDGLNLRVEATTGSASKGVVLHGTQVEVLEDAVDGWYKVSYNGQTGYMSAEFLKVTPAAPEESAPVAEAPEAEAEEEGLGNGKVTLTSGMLNLRAEPNTDSKCLGSICNGAVLALEESVDGWYRVTYHGVAGYVSGDYIVPTDEEIPEAGSGSEIVDFALQFNGCRYVYGGTGPNVFDCSGLTYYVYQHFGYILNRTASGQLSNGVAVDKADLQPGDIVLFRDFGSAYAATHVGLYIGDGQFIHAANSRSGVKITPLSDSWYVARYVGARRIIG